jgi:hypothetical protein
MRIFLHIGIHKTGTTSLQAYLHRHRQWLIERGYEFYHGMYGPENHAELHGAAMRDERRSPFRDFHRITHVPALRPKVEQRVADFIAERKCDRLIFSAEGLCYLRHDDELRRLGEMLPPACTTVIVYLRDKTEFLRSYRAELVKQRWPLSNEQGNYAYCEPDSWLTDFDALLAVYAAHYPDIRVKQYDDIVASQQSIIPSFLEEIGVTDHAGTDTGIFLNVAEQS